MRYSPRSSVACEDCPWGMILPFKYVIWYAVTLAFGKTCLAAFFTRPVLFRQPTAERKCGGFPSFNVAIAWRPGMSK
jgi:hypothetical protein